MFEEWYLDELINKKIRDIWKLTDYYLIKLIFNILEITEIKILLNLYISVEEIIKIKKYPGYVYKSLEWMLDRLAIDNYVFKVTENNINKYILNKNISIDYDLNQIKNQAEKEAPDSLAAFNLLKLVADNYPDFLSGKKNGVDILFSPENIEITNEYYRNNLFYNVHNIAGAKILNYDIKNRDYPEILEIGGGLGGGTKQFLLQRINDNEPLDNFKYTFSDIANKMLRITKKELSKITDNLNNFNFIKLDFNQKFTEQNFKYNSFDVIWGVNAAHVAYDLRFSLEEFYNALKTNGSLIISETVRPAGNTMIQQEFILNTLTDYWNVKIDPKIRPRYGFMDWKDWINAFKEIGFKKVETIPDMSILDKKYDNCYVAVIRGIKE